MSEIDPTKTGPIGINSFALNLIYSYQPDLLPPPSEGDALLAEFDQIYREFNGDAKVVIGGELAWYPPDEEVYLSMSHAEPKIKSHFDPTLN